MKLNDLNYFKANYLLAIICFGLCMNCASVPPEVAPKPTPEPVVQKINEPSPVIIIPPSPPKSVTINLVSYDFEKMTIKWHSSQEPNFKSYSLLTTREGDSKVDTLAIVMDARDTSFSYQEFDPTIRNWFWIAVTNGVGLNSNGKRATHLLEVMPPEKSVLSPIEFDGLLKLRWSKNYDNDFSNYEIHRSSTLEMRDRTVIDVINNAQDTLFIIPMDSIYYYQVVVVDKWGLKSNSNIIKGDYTVDIWDRKFSIINTREIDLSSKNLVGNIPPKIRNLLNLEVLKVQNNFLEGNFLESICQLKNLRHLNLSNNQLSGPIPISIHYLKNLEELWLSKNQFNGELPYQIFMLENLKHLNLSENDINGEFSESISRLSNLEYLNLWDNRISGLIPRGLGELKKLEFLSLGGNQFIGTIPEELADAENLRSIALFENHLIGVIPGKIGALKKLQYLSLFDNELVGKIPDDLMNSLDLSYFRINNNRLDSINHESMCESGYDWSNYIYFDVSGNEFEDPPLCFSTKEMRTIQSSFLSK